MASHRNTLVCFVFPQCPTQSPWSDLLLPEVCSDMHTAFSGLPGICTARFPSKPMVPLLESLFQLLPWMPARHAASVFHRHLVVSPLPSRPASEFPLIPASVSTASPCAQHVCCLTSIRIPVGPLHELCFPVISPPNHNGLVRGTIFVSKCAVRTHSIDVATLPVEGKLIPLCTVPYPWFSETKVLGTPITS